MIGWAACATSALAGCASTSSTSPALGWQEPAPTFAADEGFSVGLRYDHASPAGDFDGEHVLSDGSAVIVLPDVDAGGGPAFTLGYRSAEDAFSVGYSRTDHDGTFLGAGIDVEFERYLFDYRHFFRTTERLQPFFLLGFAVAQATIEDGSSDGVAVGDGELTGFDFEGGGGAAYFFNPHFSLGLQGSYRWARYGHGEGVGIEGTIDDSVEADGFVFGLGLTYTF